MDENAQIAQFIADMERSGVNMDHASISDGVVFKSEKSARIFCEKFKKDLVQVDGGWLAKNRANSD